MFKTTTQKTVDFGWFSIRQKPQTVQLPELPTIPPQLQRRKPSCTTWCSITRQNAGRPAGAKWFHGEPGAGEQQIMPTWSVWVLVQLSKCSQIEKQTLQTQKRKHTFGCKETRAHTVTPKADIIRIYIKIHENTGGSFSLSPSITGRFAWEVADCKRSKEATLRTLSYSGPGQQGEASSYCACVSGVRINVRCCNIARKLWRTWGRFTV